jgi:glycosyltransferase involved in cell wall biosynthesis
MPPRVSVVIPARNEEGYIARTLKSVEENKKHYPNIDTMVVCDSCTDNTALVVKQFAGVKLDFVDARKPSVAKNKGADSASQLLVFLDADTALSPEAVKEMAERMQAGECFGSLSVRPHPNRKRAKFMLGWKNTVFRMGMYPGTNGVVFCSKELFDKVGGFDANLAYGEDGEFSNKANAHAPYCFITSSTASTSMRRFEEKGYFSVMLYWIRAWFRFKLGRKNGEYEVIR